MSLFDRIILSSITLGIWAWVLITFLLGEHVNCYLPNPRFTSKYLGWKTAIPLAYTGLHC